MCITRGSVAHLNASWSCYFQYGLHLGRMFLWFFEVVHRVERARNPNKGWWCSNCSKMCPQNVMSHHKHPEIVVNATQITSKVQNMPLNRAHYICHFFRVLKTVKYVPNNPSNINSSISSKNFINSKKCLEYGIPSYSGATSKSGTCC